MLVYYNYTDKLLIHPDFSKDLLVDIFKPYLFYYFMISYGIKGTEKIFIYKKVLYEKLNDFYNYNKTFGRKIYIAAKNKGDKIKSSFRFDSKHIKFFYINAIQNVYPDSESESETGYDSE